MPGFAGEHCFEILAEVWAVSGCWEIAQFVPDFYFFAADGAEVGVFTELIAIAAVQTIFEIGGELAFSCGTETGFSHVPVFLSRRWR